MSLRNSTSSSPESQHIFSLSLSNSLRTPLQVDLTEYVERHEFVFDAVLDEDVSNDEVSVRGNLNSHHKDHLTGFMSHDCFLFCF